MPQIKLSPMILTASSTRFWEGCRFQNKVVGEFQSPKKLWAKIIKFVTYCIKDWWNCQIDEPMPLLSYYSMINYLPSVYEIENFQTY